MPRRKAGPFKACIRCKLLVQPNVKVCPNCGSRAFSDDWTGMVIILDVKKSKVANELQISKPGVYALKVR